MYVTKSGDTWDGIAKTVYGDEMRADVLMAANREYNDVYQFDSGVQHVTPEVTAQTEAEILPPWKKLADRRVLTTPSVPVSRIQRQRYDR